MLTVACTLLTLAAGVYVLTPLFREARGNIEVELLAETGLDRLLARKAVVYANLKDLEFEYRMGRLSDGDFRRLEAGYKAEAAAILRELDQLGVAGDLDESIERDIAARKSRLYPSVAKETSRCPSCGAEVTVGKKFCADCGQRL
ncbi:MAG: zinc ribbon domain-containing protein [Acidobacteria bacterium]|nr:zinc ribbon domain-containing protein [Acidobacteriota bacterium]